jgi:hypothetical protein
MATSTKPHLTVNPVIEALTGGPGDLSSLTRCMGYVGRSNQPGVVRLYFRLIDPSQYIEFKESAVVRTMRAPRSQLSQGGVMIWLRANSPVRAVRSVTMEARALAAVVTRNRQLKQRQRTVNYLLRRNAQAKLKRRPPQR